MADKQKFPSEVVDLPSGGTIYGKDSPLYDGKIEIKYMTAKEEDILTSTNLIKKGVVIDKLLDSLILSEGVTSDDLILGDKNAVMVASRVLAYGSEYTTKFINPAGGDQVEHTFNLTDCPFKELPSDVDYSKNEFELTLPITKINITFKLLTGNDETNIENELKSLKKIGKSGEVTTRLKNVITSVDGNSEKSAIYGFVDNMLSKESFFLRDEIQRINPDINLTQEVEIRGESTEMDIPMTVEFFWPKSSR